MNKSTNQLEISLDFAKSNKLFYFVVTGIIYHPKLKKCLVLKRSEKEIAHPGLWGVTGGKLEWEDLENNKPSRQNFDITDWEGMVESLLYREAKEESNLEVTDPKYLTSVVFLRPDKVPVVCLKFAVKYKSGEVKIPGEFDGFKWVTAEEAKQLKCIQGIPEEIEQTTMIYLDELGSK